MRGWNQDENELLLKAVQKAEVCGYSLQNAFLQVAVQTGRKSDSVRNHYYMTLRPGRKKSSRFTTFTEEESDRLLREILSSRAKGESVRACALRLANGDSKAMLRYQNKYHALLRNAPDRVRTICAELERCGINVPDPYLSMRTRNPQADKISIPEQAIRTLLDRLYESLIAFGKEETAKNA